MVARGYGCNCNYEGIQEVILRVVKLFYTVNMYEVSIIQNNSNKTYKKYKRQMSLWAGVGVGEVRMSHYVALS